MRRRLTLVGISLLAAFLWSHDAKAQEKEFSFGGLVGATESRLTNLDGYRYTFVVPQFRDNLVDVTGGDSEFNAGVMFGGWVFWNASRHVGLQFGVAYSQQGGKLTQAGSQRIVDRAIRDSTLVQYDLEHTFESRYVRIPILAKVHVPTKYVSPYLKAGPEIGILTSATQETKGSYSTPQLSGSRLYPINEKRDLDNDFKTLSVGFDVAVGAEVPIGPVAALVESG